METGREVAYALTHSITVADCEDCLAVWKQHRDREQISIPIPTHVADCEDCLAVWKQFEIKGKICPAFGVADCEDCLAVWKQGPPEWERAF